MTSVRLSFRRGLLIACGLSLSLSAMAFSAPPTDEQIQTKMADLGKWQREAKGEERTFENYQKKVAELLADVNATGEQVEVEDEVGRSCSLKALKFERLVGCPDLVRDQLWFSPPQVLPFSSTIGWWLPICG